MHEEQKMIELIEKDQLRSEIVAKRAFAGFCEGDIHFMPTFKVDPSHSMQNVDVQVERESGCVYNIKRLPAWCDRILWKSTLPSKSAEILNYYSVPEFPSSDHKPVAAHFKVPTSDLYLPGQSKTIDPVFYDYGFENEDQAMIVLSIQKLRAEGLFMIKQQTTRDLTAPNPQAESSRRPKVYALAL